MAGGEEGAQTHGGYPTGRADPVLEDIDISTRAENAEPAAPPTLRQRYTDGARAAIAPVVRGLARLGITPNAITFIGLAGAVATAGLILGRYWLAAGFVFAAANIMDSLDGSLARLTGRETRMGAFLDSTFDRLSEALILGAMGVTLGQDGTHWAVAVTFVAVAASFLVSYTRARAEGLGVHSNKGGLMSRPERLVLTAAGVFFAPIPGVLETVVVVLAALSALTVVQRLLHVRAALARGDRDTTG
ncbi:MAG: CDP-alcohol phosphatidyltransferase family protein [Actinomycetota bacterium]